MTGSEHDNFTYCNFIFHMKQTCDSMLLFSNNRIILTNLKSSVLFFPLVLHKQTERRSVELLNNKRDRGRKSEHARVQV